MVVRPSSSGVSPPESPLETVKIRLEDPVSRFFRYPLARLLVRGLVRTSITPNQITLAQPCLAAVAAWLIASDQRWRLVLAVVIFEVRSILDCVDGTLARARNLASPWGHAIDGLADWLSVIFLYAGITLHFQAHPPPYAPVGVTAVLSLALFQGAIRSFASDHYKQKYAAIFGRGGDATVESPREKAPALGPESGLFAHAEVLIGQLGRLAFERARATEEQVRELRRHERSPSTRLIFALWSVSNGDAFITLVCLSVVVGKLWEGQVFFASAGLLWIGGVIALNRWFLRSAARRGALSAARAI
jgi:phosphatidylglycerophosphate synthase